MPFPAMLAAAIEGVSAIGGAVASGVSAASSAIGGLTLSGIATGANIVGSGLSLIGMATGNKTLSKIGMGFSIAGGIGSGFGMAKDMFAPSAVRGSGSALLNSEVDDLIAMKTKGVTSTDDILNAKPRLSSVPEAPNLKFNQIEDDISSADKSQPRNSYFSATPEIISNSASKSAPETINNFASKSSGLDKLSSSQIAADSDPTSAVKTYTPETRSVLNRINDTLTKYSMPMNILGGMGEAYMLKQQLDQRDRMQKRDLQMEQNAVDRRSQMPANFQTYPNVRFNPNAYNGLLRGN